MSMEENPSFPLENEVKPNYFPSLTERSLLFTVDPSIQGQGRRENTGECEKTREESGRHNNNRLFGTECILLCTGLSHCRTEYGLMDGAYVTVMRIAATPASLLLSDAPNVQCPLPLLVPLRPVSIPVAAATAAAAAAVVVVVVIVVS